MKKLLLFLFLAISFFAFSQTVIYPVVAGVPLNPDFIVRIDDGSGFKNVPVQDIVDVCYAHFALTGSVTIEITASAPITTYRIGPQRLGISPVIASNKMTFTLTNPAKLIILINAGAGNHTTGYDGLCIIADTPETDVPLLTDPNVVNIMSYGVDNTGATMERTKIQQAFNDNDGARKIIYFPAGIYKTGMLHARSKQSIYLAPGAVLLGSDVYADYDQIPGEGNATEKYLIGSWLSDSIRLYGRGVVNGNGTVLRLQDPTGAGYKTHNIQFQGSDYVRIEGVISLNAGSWSIEPIQCDYLLIDNVKVMSDLRYYGALVKLNNDGIDINTCRHVTVQNCLVWGSDDALTPKIDLASNMFTLRDSYDILFKDNVVYTRKCGVKVGSETLNSSLQFYNITVDGLDVVFADRAISILSFNGALIHDLIFKNIYIEKTSTEYKKNHIHCGIDTDGNSIKNVLFQNIHALEPAPLGSVFEGDNVGSIINSQTVQYYNIRFSNYTIAGQPVLSLANTDAKFDLDKDAVDANASEFFFDTGVSINENKATKVKAYPNPVRDILTIEHPENAAIRIYNTLGTVLFTTSSAGVKTIVNSTDINADGIVLVHVFSGNMSTILKTAIVK